MGNITRHGFSIAVAFLLLSMLAASARGSDDSNSNELSRAEHPIPPSVVSNATISALENLGKNVNDARFQELFNQLRNQVRNGDYDGAQNTLSQLKDYVNSPGSGDIPASLKALINSLSVGPNGLTVDPRALQNLVGEPSPEGPTGLKGMDPVQAMQDLETLAGLAKYVDPNVAHNLSLDALELRESILSGLLPGKEKLDLNDIQVPPGLNADLPNIQLPSPTSQGISPLPSAGSPLGAAGGVPSLLQGLGLPPGQIGLLVFIPVIVMAGIVAALYLAKKPPSILVGKITRRGGVSNKSAGLSNMDLRRPRDRIILYFWKAVDLMRLRGVPKMQFETHREFSSKCNPRAEGEHVERVSGLYEKVMFSGREATSAEADDAGARVDLIMKAPSEG